MRRVLRIPDIIRERPQVTTRTLCGLTLIVYFLGCGSETGELDSAVAQEPDSDANLIAPDIGLQDAAVDQLSDAPSGDPEPTDVTVDLADRDELTDPSGDGSDRDPDYEVNAPDAGDQTPDRPAVDLTPFTMQGAVFNNSAEDAVDGDPRAGRLWVLLFSEPFVVAEGTLPAGEAVAWIDLGLTNQDSWESGIGFEVSGEAALYTRVYPVAVLKRSDGADELDAPNELTPVDLVGSLLGGDELRPESHDFTGRYLEVCAVDRSGHHTRCHFGGD